MDEEVSERITALERRVSHLEEELDTSYDEWQFEHVIRTPFSEDVAVELSTDGGYYHAHVVGISTNELNRALEMFGDRDDLETAVTETSEGLGLEVWKE